ncbi:hypothetical protein [Miltoncostaea oceani]|uniref:hypothetical protein n=1 Tax=Miltoncostaea oceani TaxID=2843216 RepID=UPI001C3CEC82|nr:hypothetical protein [Miltoncostaea oceani]
MNRWERILGEEAPDPVARADALRQQVEDALQAVEASESRRRRFNQLPSERVVLDEVVLAATADLAFVEDRALERDRRRGG